MTNPSLEKTCDRFRGEMRKLLRRLAASRVVVAVILLLATVIGLDWYFRFLATGRWVLLVVLLGTTAFIVIREFAWPRRREWSDLEVLSTLDAADADSHDRLVSLYELARPEEVGETVTDHGRATLEYALRQLAPEVGRIDVTGALTRGHVRAWQKAAAVTLVAAIIVTVMFYGEVGIGLMRVFLPFVEVKWPTLTTLEVAEPETGWRIPQGEDFRVVTNVRGQRPAEIELVYSSSDTDYWITEHVTVDADGRAVHTLEEVEKPVEFYLRGGDDRTRRFTIDVIEKPRITRTVAYYEYPSYAGIPNRRIRSAQIRGLEGTRVKIDFECSVPLKSAVWVLAGRPEETLALTSETTFSKTLQLRESGQYAVKLMDLHGFREYRPERYDIQVTPDEPPVVRLLSPDAELVATHRAKPTFIFEVTDDFGLSDVKFMYALRSKTAPTPLSDRITGPITRTGKASRAEFSWDFAKMAFSDSVDIEYWVTAIDCNPTGRGRTESTHRRISVLKTTDFHLRILYEARKVLAEARVAYRSQKQAYHLGRDWVAKHPSGKADDETWREIVAKQALSRRASQAVKRWLDELSGHIKRNRMDDAFMRNRLAVIEDLRSGAHRELSAAVAVLEKAHPRNAAEAEDARLKATRLEALGKAADRQKLATIGLGRMLRKMYDWENLQTALLNTRLLRERQAEIHEITRTIAPVTIGREAEDLDEKTLDRVLVLAQQQTAVMETEANLEAQLASIALKANAEGRRSVQRVLLTAYGYLRDIQLARSLKQIARKIAANRLSDVTTDQLEVVTAMKVVEGGLVKAGADVETDDIVNAADLLKREAEDVEVARVKPEARVTGEEGTLQIDEAAVRKLIEAVVPMAEDDLSQALVKLAEDQDTIRSHTRYLAKTLTANDMPRYRRLKMGMLRYRQGMLVEFAGKRLATLAETSQHRERVTPALAALAGATRATRGLFEVSDISEGCRELQGNIIEDARDVAQFIARQKQAGTLAADHQAKGGVDDFNRAFVLTGVDLAKALEVYAKLDWCRTRQRMLARSSEWLKRQGERPKAHDVMKRLAGARTAETARTQADVARELTSAKNAAESFSAAVKKNIEATGLARVPAEQLAAASGRIRQGVIDVALRDQQDQAVEKMRLTLRRLRDLMDERVALVETPTEEPTTLVTTTDVKPKSDEKVYYTEEEVAKESTPEAIRANLETTDRIAPDIKARMLRQLPDAFPEKYRRLIGAYYRSLLAGADEGEEWRQTP